MHEILLAEGQFLKQNLAKLPHQKDTSRGKNDIKFAQTIFNAHQVNGVMPPAT